MIRKIAERFMNAAKDLGVTLSYDQLDVQLSITAVHLNGCPLDLFLLMYSEDVDLAHDVGGIMKNCDHKTGKINGQFWPRTARRFDNGTR